MHPIAKKKNSNEHPIVKKKISNELKKEKLPIDVDPFPEVSTKDKAQKPTKLVSVVYSKVNSSANA